MIVYIYTFPNGKKYVGQTSRTLQERAKNGEGYSNSPAVYNAIKKYGWNNIIKETFPCQSKEEMDRLEQYYIKLYKTYNIDSGYNLTLGGDGTLKYDRQQVCDLWNQGLGITEIANLLHCQHQTVSQILISEGLYNKQEVENRKRKRISETSGEKLKLYYSSKEHQTERKNNGLKGAKARSKPVAVYKDKDKTILIGIYESGRQCAKALGIDHSVPLYALTHNHYGKGYYFYFVDET